VLFLGQRRGYKGYDLVEAAAARVPEATFAFVGPGPAVHGANVIDAGLVDDDERAAWLDAADLLCLPSEAEILPVSILEAWSTGTPFLASEIPPLRELAESGGGWVAPRDVNALAARLRDLVRDAEALRAAGELGRSAWESQYTPGAVAAAYAGVYSSLVEQREPVCAS
jgi:glycosyltransferase involved in cell wall biosynthesis